MPKSQPLVLLHAEEQLAVPSPSSPVADELTWEMLALDRLNPLVAAAAALLGLSAQLKSSASHIDVEALRLRVLREIDAFERRITPLGLPSRAIKVCKYALCATIDDIVLNTAWGSNSVWTTRSLVGSLFSDTWGGERFFDLLTQLKNEPAINIELLELLYYCMRLGFEGRYRVTAGGAAELSVLCEDVYRLIRAARGDFERELSPHWRRNSNNPKPRRTIVPIWAVVAFGAGLLLSIYTGLLHALNARADAVFNDIATLPPNGVVRSARIALPPKVVMSSDRLRNFLEPEIREGLVTVSEDPQQIVVIIRASGMFDSASPEVKKMFLPLLLRIGRSLNGESGSVLLTGHTDAIPVQSLAFPSNDSLSLARASAAAEIIKSMMDDPGRVREEGRGSGEPVASNHTPEGRARNRRIQIIITKTQ